jgi:hypothetical protein
MIKLTAYEKETVINFNDEDDFALVTTYQRTVMTKLRKNTSAEEITTDALAAFGGAMFKLPVASVSFRNGPRKPMSTEHKAKLAANVAKARAAKGS